MESIRTAAASPAIDGALQRYFDHEFDAMVSVWETEQGEYSEARDCLDALLEARAVMASMQAQEQRCLARLETLALASAEPNPSGTTSEIA